MCPYIIYTEGHHDISQIEILSNEFRMLLWKKTKKTKKHLFSNVFYRSLIKAKI